MLHFNFNLLDEKNFKEDSVRAFIIDPLLQALGFVVKDQEKNNTLEVVLSMKIDKPTYTGSNEKIMLTRFPDYVLFLNGKARCVLDAKVPDKPITQGKSVQQAFYYAINEEVKAPYYALCNGRKLTLFQVSGQELVLEIDLKNELREKFSELQTYLTEQGTPTKIHTQKDDSWYLTRSLPSAILKPKKQAKARYFGCTGYFTRQSWDVVAQHIKNFTQKEDVVLDPFGGSGVTAIEAMMEGRIGLHTDLNPLSVFMAKALSARVNLSDLGETAEMVLQEFEKVRPTNAKEAKAMLKTARYYPNAIDKEFGLTATRKMQDDILWIPQDEALPNGSDVDHVLGLFSPLQLAELALLRKLILAHTNRKKELRYSLLLAFYNTITMHNLTFHETKSRKGKAGVCGIFAYYRYRIAKSGEYFNLSEIYRGKVMRVIRGKKELEISPNFYDAYFEYTTALREKTEANNGDKIFAGDATNLIEIQNKSVDLIYTDPPYGAKIPYLDLSTMWNVWLDFSVDKDMREKECIEKGSLDKTKKEYQDLMKTSLREMYRVLKFNRWLCFVFQHQDSHLWQILVDAAENTGFEYVGYIDQDNGQSSFKKVQNPTRILKGQLILYFKKVDTPKARIKENMGSSIELFLNDMEAVIVRDGGANLETLYAQYIKKAAIHGYAHKLGLKIDNLIPIINDNFSYDATSQKYQLMAGKRVKSESIPLQDRAHYFLHSFLMEAESKGERWSFDKLCLQTLPLLKNGVDASRKNILDVLKKIAIEDKKNQTWRLKPKDNTQPNLFDDSDEE